ncbi:MAG: hypothetical protein ABIN94_03070 [Ferruginibacter sp.]
MNHFLSLGDNCVMDYLSAAHCMAPGIWPGFPLFSQAVFLCFPLGSAKLAKSKVSNSTVNTIKL